MISFQNMFFDETISIKIYLEHSISEDPKYSILYSWIWNFVTSIALRSNYPKHFWKTRQFYSPDHILMAQLSQKQHVISLKFRYSEEATKMWPIFHSFFDITCYVVSNYKWKMGQLFVAFSEYLNFMIL